MLVEAYDSAVPDEVVTEAITVSVSRNNYDPRFEMANYTATINDFDDPGTVVGAVKAIDSDPQVFIYWIRYVRIYIFHNLFMLLMTLLDSFV